ncbi:CLIP domain-containing serine protease 14D-like, partial [Thrips palmi]|uniref:CLIP domain-containing serine protease n=1 Tax=Thrips palmi TaxID=161013 RepID=A0A6P8ZKS3_THRPL
AAFVLVLAQPAAAQSGSSCFTPDDRPGSCIPVVRCPPLVALLRKKPVPPESVQFLRNSQCGFEAAAPLVCCQNTDDRAPSPAVRPATSDRPDPVTPLPKSPSGPSPHDGHPNAGLLPTDVCGIDLHQHIIFGGNKTELGEFPWMALLEYRSPRGQLGFYCGGVLIAKRYVLTAAHCVQEDAIRLVSVRLGEHDTKTSPDCRPDFFGGQICAAPAVDVPVERAIPHPEYAKNDPNHYHDIALLRLSRDVQFTDWIAPICLPASSEVAAKSYVGKRRWVAGWGKTETRSESDVKLKLAVPVVSNADCQPVYQKAAVRLSSGGQLCAGGAQGRDSCNGDSGGPLMGPDLHESGDIRWFSTGVVAFGPRNCGTRGWPGVYTRVAHYMPWILDTIRD